MSIITITEDNFDLEILQSTTPVLLDFWAEWCAPCKALTPILDELSTSFENKLIVAKLNIDDYPMPATKYNIRGIPTMILFKDGEVLEIKVGGSSLNELESWVHNLID